MHGRFRLLPRWTDEELVDAQRVPLESAQEDAERALLQAVAAHARETMSADADTATAMTMALAAAQGLAFVRGAIIEE